MSTTRFGSDFPPTDAVSSEFLNIEASILKGVVCDVGYGPLEVKLTNKPLEDFMRAEMESGNFGCEQLERTLHLAASLIEVAYYERSLEEKKFMALFNWYLIYVDDMAPKDPSKFSVFEQRFLSGQPQLNPILDAFVGLLLRLWDLYDPLCANNIMTSVFGFFTSTCIEPDIERMPLIRGTQRFSWFVRDGTGVAVAFALLMFTKTTQIDIMEYIQAIPDMNFWICILNDVLSFHKEQLAGETSNYVHNRAYIDNKAPLQVLAEMAGELRMSRNTIYKALSGSPRALHAWKVFEHGYLGWHLAQGRYKLKDLGL